MQKEHQKLLEQYKQNQKLHDRATKKTIILEIFLVIIVCAMKAMEKSASLRLNLMATSLVVLLTVWHFWDIYVQKLHFIKFILWRKKAQ